MDNNYITTSSFEKTHDIISVLNTISIYSKLKLSGKTQIIKDNEIKIAKDKFKKFLSNFNKVIQEAEKQPDNIIINTDPRFEALITRYIHSKKYSIQDKEILNIPIIKIIKIIESKEESEISILITYIKSLRSILEQHAYVDYTKLISNI